LILFCFCLFVFDNTGFRYLAQASLKLMILLLRASECWGYRCVPLHPQG
jgi:hypothetical protein